MFNDSFEISSERVPISKILRGLDQDLKNDLIKIHEGVVRKFPKVYEKFDGRCFITKGTSDNVNYGGKLHRRSQFHELQRGYVVSKGSGFNNWQEDKLFAGTVLNYGTFDGSIRSPITVKYLRKKNSFETHRYIGGMHRYFAYKEFQKGLMLFRACKKTGVGVQPSIPISINTIDEIPMSINGNIKIVNSDDDWHSTRNRSGRMLKPNDLSQLRVLNYISSNPLDRVCSLRQKNDKLATMVFDINDTKRNEIVRNFSERLARTVSSAHCYGGTFSEVYGDDNSVSSLSSTNVTTEGEILDWDTISFDNEGMDFKKSVYFDFRFLLNTLNVFSSHYDVFDNGDFLLKTIVFGKNKRKVGASVNGELSLNDYAFDKFIEEYNKVLGKSEEESLTRILSKYNYNLCI